MRDAIGNVVENYQNGLYNCHIGLILHFLTICCEHSQHPQRLGPNMQQLRQPQNKTIGIEPAAENDGVGMFEKAGTTAD